MLDVMAKKRVPNQPPAAEQKTDTPNQLRLPTLTHLQFLVLDVLTRRHEGASAQEVMDELSSFSADYRGPKFYQLMGRLADSHLITSWSQDFDAAGTTVTRTFYRIAPEGATAWRITCAFYESRFAIGKLLNKPES